jgi:hypothetical protein
MICPSCKIETQIQEQKTDYIYPNAFLGMPTFWSFITPVGAKIITITIAVIGVISIDIVIESLSRGSVLQSVASIVICFITIYSAIICISSLNKYKIKKYYKCLSCRLEWYGIFE